MRRGSCDRGHRGVGWLLSSVLLAACGQSASSGSGNFEQGAGIVGNLEAYVATYEDGTTAIFYGLRTTSGETIDLVFPDAPDIDPGSYVAVEGPRDAENKLHVTSIHRRANPLEPGPSRELAAPGYDRAPVSLKVAVLILDSAYTVAQARKRLLDDFDGPKSFFRENTYGLWNLDGDAFGPYTVDVSSCSTRYTQIATDARAAAKSAGVPIESYNQVAYYLPKSAGCGWGGLGMAGKMPSRLTTGTYKPARDTWYAGSFGCVVFNQELAHNYGLQHGHYCASPPYNGGCSGYSEYGDPHTPLGTGCGHLTAVETGELNGFAPCNVIDVGDGSYQIGPIEFTCAGPQVLRWKDPQGAQRAEYVHLEYRRKAGHDANRAEGIYIHYGAEFKDPNVVGWQTPANGASDFLVGAGGSASKAALLAGQSWTAVGGAVFRVASLGDLATIEVTKTGKASGATCLDMTPAPTMVTCGGTPDGGTPDAGTIDAGVTDVVTVDIGTRDTAAPDVALPEGGASDGGVRDRDNGVDIVSDGRADTDRGDGRGAAGAAGSGAAGAGGASAGAGGASGGTGGASAGAGGASPGRGGAPPQTGGASGSGNSSGRGGGTTPPADDGGCSCRLTHRENARGAGWETALVFGVLVRRRRARRCPPLRTPT